jgi:hypothetical protein
MQEQVVCSVRRSLAPPDSVAAVPLIGALGVFDRFRDSQSMSLSRKPSLFCPPPPYCR